MDTPLAHGRARPLRTRRHGLFALSLVLLLTSLGCSSEATKGTPAPTAPPPEETTSPPAARQGPQPALQRVPDARELAPYFNAGAALAASGWRPHDLDKIRTLLRASQNDLALEALSSSLDLYEGESLHVARFLYGKTLTQLGSPNGRASLEALPSPFHPVEDLRLTWQSRARLMDGALDSALSTYEKIEKTSDEVYALRIDLALALGEAGRQKEGLSLLEKNRKAGLKVPRGTRAETLRAKADLLREGSPDAAASVERRLLVSHPSQRATLRPGLSLQWSALSLKDRHKRAVRLRKDMAYVEAREAFQDLLESRYHTEALWNIGEISSRWYRDDPKGAREAYLELAERSSPYAPKLAYREVHTYLREHNYEKALSLVKSRFSRAGELGLYYRAWIPYELRSCEAAKPELKAYADRYEDTTFMGFYAWCFIREGDWEGAVDAFERLVGYGNPIVQGKAWYWQAYALNKLDRRDEALEKLKKLHNKWPLTYYDILGYQMEAKWEGRDPRASKIPILASGGGGATEALPGEEAWSWPALSTNYQEKLDHVRDLVALDELERARAAYAEIRDAVERRVPKEKRWAFIYFMGDQTQNYHHGFKKASGGVRALSDEMPDPQDPKWWVAYPMAYRDLVEPDAMSRGLPHYLVYGIMLQESRFRWYQVSSWDALGVLQMIPKTAVLVAKDLGIEYEKATFMEPRVGIPFSVYYMAKHFEMWGNLTLTAASYNGGPHKVERWMRRDEGQPMDLLIEEFSFNQSRHYCRKVAEHTLRYVYLYESDPEERARIYDLLFPVEVSYDIPDDTGY